MFNNDELKIITTTLQSRIFEIDLAIEYENELNELNELIIEKQAINFLINKIIN